MLAAGAALVAAAIALAFGARAARRARPVLSPLRLAARTVSLGYAVPGAVIAVGMLAAAGWLQARWPDSGAGVWFTATVLGLLYAYVVRF